MQHDFKTDKSNAHKAKFVGPGLNDGDVWECVTTNKDHEQKYWAAVPAWKEFDGAVKL